MNNDTFDAVFAKGVTNNLTHIYYDYPDLRDQIIDECHIAFLNCGELPVDTIEWVIIGIAHAVCNSHNVTINCDDDDYDNDLITFDMLQADIENVIQGMV